jgi:hypothetical protein
LTLTRHGPAAVSGQMLSVTPTSEYQSVCSPARPTAHPPPCLARPARKRCEAARARAGERMMRDAACPVSTGRRTRRVQLVQRGRAGGHHSDDGAVERERHGAHDHKRHPQQRERHHHTLSRKNELPPRRNAYRQRVAAAEALQAPPGRRCAPFASFLGRKSLHAGLPASEARTWRIGIRCCRNALSDGPFGMNSSRRRLRSPASPRPAGLLILATCIASGVHRVPPPSAPTPRGSLRRRSGRRRARKSGRKSAPALGQSSFTAALIYSF